MKKYLILILFPLLFSCNEPDVCYRDALVMYYWEIDGRTEERYEVISYPYDCDTNEPLYNGGYQFVKWYPAY